MEVKQPSQSALIPVILQVACALAITRPIPGGGSEQHSNSFLANLSLRRRVIRSSGPAQALFKTVNRFVLQRALFRVYHVKVGKIYYAMQHTILSKTLKYRNQYILKYYSNY
jgi:hypothetical protein